MEETAAALLACWLTEQRERTVLAYETQLPPEGLAPNADQSASDNFVGEDSARSSACSAPSQLSFQPSEPGFSQVLRFFRL
jgi:hypothetical protein